MRNEDKLILMYKRPFRSFNVECLNNVGHKENNEYTISIIECCYNRSLFVVTFVFSEQYFIKE